MIDFTKNSIEYLKFIDEMKLNHLLDEKGDSISFYWNNIAIDYKGLKILYNIFKPNMKFLELGCGIGNVLLFAKNIGYNVTGVEINAKFIQYLSNYNNINENILNLKPEFYYDYDVIYSYVPLKENYLGYLKDNIIPNMKQGSFLITPSKIFQDDKIKMIHPFTYQKI